MDKDSEVTSDKYGEQVEGFENIAGGAIKLNAVTSEVDMNPGILDEDPEARKRLYQAGKEFNETYNKNVDYMIEGWHRPEVAKKEMLVLEEKIAKEKNPEMKNLLTARYNYLEQEAHPIRSIKEGFVSGFKEGAADAITLYAASKIPVFGKYVTVGTIIYGGVKHAINAAKEEPKIAITFKQANDIKRIAPEFYKDAESSFIIGKKSDVSNSVLIGAAEYYYKNNKTPDKRLGNSTGYLAGGVVAYKGINIAESKYNSLKTLTSDPNLVSANEVTNGEQLLLENKVNSVQGKVFINDGTPGGTTIARQTILTDSSGNMIKLQDNLTTGETSLQGINSSGQLIFEKSLTPYKVNPFIGTSSSSKMLVGNGVVSKVGQVQNNRLVLENTLIWNKITPVYPDISPTFIPRAFIIESNGKKFFVTPNATKHIAEDFIKKHYLADGSDINYALKNQILLKGFGAALDQITNSEIQYGKKYYTDNWEIMINKRLTDKYPAIYHGIIREGVKK
ncbi:hypothetical protein [Fusobacterium nucleatum]|uniref:hypothetical protein n=1 Tax=Fusobacterium nucleatum TaxID=851 RepID=UPI00201B1511|nr:hypothetical protein [Fusobacterium nucleatum]MCL4592834.1 hypothetical protein [Fusobacterium nucleatum YWH7053]